MPRARGFTLIEMLVVIAVIAILVALSIPAISAIKRRSQVKATEAFFHRLRLQIEAYANDFGDYPPSSFKKLGLRKSNKQNDGVECLLRCLTTASKGGPYVELKDAQMGNADGDRLVKSGNPTNSVFKTRDLLEITDQWGSPIVYIHNTDYDRGGTMTKKGGGTANVPAAKSEKTGQFQGLTSFQLFSAGPDGEVGTHDDVRAWGE